MEKVVFAMGAVWAFVREMHRLYSRHNISRAAGALAYFFVLSFFPLLLCVNTFVGMAHVDIQSLLHSLDRILPSQALELAGEYVDYVSKSASPALLYAAIPAIILSASAALRVILDTMDELYDHPRDTGVRRIAVSVLFCVLFLITVYLSVLVIFTGDWFLRWLAHILPEQLAAMVNLALLSDLWRWLRYLLLFCFVCCWY